MREYSDFTFEEKTELAKYLINNWNYQGSEKEELELEATYSHAEENVANGKPIRWACTPSNLIDDIIFDDEEERW